ncbi:XRE family transcriptional regulator [Glycocaulis alkaliphilus]|uniref:XRE family transcriptional regulator n=2 Tax=Glycocaulis alkaliphilus TaxID=1434191 RepID=A0A3T0E787_9PROT|nr:XRE family transcriptional regulator [Glycocaulis alkaliphilus]
MTQQDLAEAVDASVYMISKMESSASGTSFSMIERLARALSLDPAELFTADLPASHFQRSAYGRITRQLVDLDEDELEWLEGVITAALKVRRPG